MGKEHTHLKQRRFLFHSAQRLPRESEKRLHTLLFWFNCHKQMHFIEQLFSVDMTIKWRRFYIEISAV